MQVYNQEWKGTFNFTNGKRRKVGEESATLNSESK